jgi:hypothetical protein
LRTPRGRRGRRGHAWQHDTHHDAGVLGAAHNGGEHSQGGIVAGEASLQRGCTWSGAPHVPGNWCQGEGDASYGTCGSLESNKGPDESPTGWGRAQPHTVGQAHAQYRARAGGGAHRGFLGRAGRVSSSAPPPTCWQVAALHQSRSNSPTLTRSNQITPAYSPPCTWRNHCRPPTLEIPRHPGRTHKKGTKRRFGLRHGANENAFLRAPVSPHKWSGPTAGGAGAGRVAPRAQTPVTQCRWASGPHPRAPKPGPQPTTKCPQPGPRGPAPAPTRSHTNLPPRMDVGQGAGCNACTNAARARHMWARRTLRRAMCCKHCKGASRATPCQEHELP